MTTERRRCILIAGGGTGGHVFPGLAVADALRELADVDVVFAGSKRGLEAKIVPARGLPLELLDVEPMKGGGAARAVRGALVAAKAMRHASGVVARLKPSAVLSVGGYAAGPAALACVGARVPLAILEPNSVLGLTNRLLAPFAARAYVAWAGTARHFRQGRARVYGVPLRQGFSPSVYAPIASVRRVLVLGGSQGATALNERLPGAIAAATRKLGEIHVVHQTGEAREAEVRKAYESAGLSTARVVTFLEDVAEQMSASDVIVARAGAVTVAEIAAIGRASILIPFPHAADDHQAKNALALAEVGGAVCLRQEVADEARLADELVSLFDDSSRRVRMAEAARAHGRPLAADDIARDLLSLAAIGTRPQKPKAKTMNGGTNGASSMKIAVSKVVS